MLKYFLSSRLFLGGLGLFLLFAAFCLYHLNKRDTPRAQQVKASPAATEGTAENTTPADGAPHSIGGGETAPPAHIHRTGEQPSVAHRHPPQKQPPHLQTATSYRPNHLFEYKDLRLARLYGGQTVRPPEVPEEIMRAVLDLEDEESARASVANNIRNGMSPEEAIQEMLSVYEDFDPAVLRENGQLITTPRTPGEMSERTYEILVGGKDIEEATRFLEGHGLYSVLHLERLDTARAAQYLMTIAPDGRRENPAAIKAREYAARVIAGYSGDPSLDLEARLYLADATRDPQRRLEKFQETLELYPDSAYALFRSGAILSDLDRPIEGIASIKQAHRLGLVTTSGHFHLGVAYQKLGDYKTAWIHLKTAQRLHLSGGGPFTKLYIRRIEAGDPVYKPLPLEHLLADIPNATEGTPPASPPETFERETFTEGPSQPDPEPPQRHEAASETSTTRPHAEAEAARKAFEAFQDLTSQEFQEFLNWAESIESATSPIDTNDFLIKEMESHLKGGETRFDPERVVRAFEIFERYGPEAGMRRLQERDPAIAAEVQRLLREKRPSGRSSGLREGE